MQTADLDSVVCLPGQTLPPGAITHTYDYDAFGNEKNPDPEDTNPFRYCGEYLDGGNGTYYLRARYYDPTIGRFTQEDTHWNTANMIYGDELGLSSYTYVPQLTAVMQSGNLYVYAMNSPIMWRDENGAFGILATMAIGAIVNVATTALAAAVTGQELSVLDIAVAAGAGALATLEHPVAKIGGGVLAGIHTARAAYNSGSGFWGAIGSGFVSAFVTTATSSTIAKKLTNVAINDAMGIVADSIFSIPGNATAAVGAKSAIILSGNKSSSTKKSVAPATPKPAKTSGKPNQGAIVSPPAPSKPGGGSGKVLMVMR